MRTWDYAFDQPPSEFEIQAELYGKLKTLGMLVRGEAIVSAEDGSKCRFDLLVFSYSKKPVAIIEVKNSSQPEKLRERWDEKKTRQRQKYETMGVPIIFCLNMSEINQTLLEVVRLSSPPLVPPLGSPLEPPSVYPFTPHPDVVSAHTHEEDSEADEDEDEAIITKTNSRQPEKHIQPSTAQKPPAGERSRSWGAENMELFSSGKVNAFNSKTMQEFMDVWNGVMVLPKVVSMRGREHKLRWLMKDEFFASNWREGIRKVAASKFCRGHNRQGTGQRPWKATVDWFLQDHVLPRILEGAYDDGKKEIQITTQDQQFSKDTF